MTTTVPTTNSTEDNTEQQPTVPTVPEDNTDQQPTVPEDNTDQQPTVPDNTDKQQYQRTILSNNQQ